MIRRKFLSNILIYFSLLPFGLWGGNQIRKVSLPYYKYKKKDFAKGKLSTKRSPLLRISVRENDPGYRRNAHMYNVSIDGKLIYNCFTADEKQGACYIYEYTNKSEKTRDLLNLCHNKKVIYGDVRIFPPS